MIIHVRTSANFREIRMGGIGPGILYRSSHPIGDGREDTAITSHARRAGIAAILNLADTSREIKWRAVLVPWYQSILDTGGVITLGMNFNDMSRQFLLTNFQMVNKYNKENLNFLYMPYSLPTRRDREDNIPWNEQFVLCFDCI